MILVHFGLSNRIIEPAFPLVWRGIPKLHRVTVTPANKRVMAGNCFGNCRLNESP